MIQQKLQQLIKQIEEKAPDKYDCAGVYSISIEDKLVYLGKSENMVKRIAAHMLNTFDEEADGYKTHKYQIFREAIAKGYDVKFDLFYQATPGEDIGEIEGRLIRQYMPVLNYQIPKEEDWHKYFTNKKAKTIKLEEIVGSL